MLSYPSLAIVLCLYVLSSPFASAGPDWLEDDTEESTVYATDDVSRGAEMVHQLGCASCHDLPSVDASIALEQAPSLAGVGDKLRPEWVYSFLKAPRSIRPNLGTRMPDFRLTEEEALNLTLFLDSLRRPMPALPDPSLEQASMSAVSTAPTTLSGKDLFKSLSCTKCHMDPNSDHASDLPAGMTAPDFPTTGLRLKPAWVLRWLLDPQSLQANSKMPSFFYYSQQTEEGGQSLVPMMKDAPASLLVLTRYWREQFHATDSAAEDRFNAARASHLHAAPDLGRRLASELNCAGCHDIPGLTGGRKIGPPLGFEGRRVQREWLQEFLLEPRTIRPRGYVPGTHSRMPGFRLSKEEAGWITEFLYTQRSGPAVEPPVEAAPEASTPGSTISEEARRLFQEEYGCIACHRIGDSAGGVIGPNLGGTGNRLQPDWIREWLASPESFLPETIMPHFDLAPHHAELIARWLQSQEGSWDSPRPGLRDFPPAVAFEDRYTPPSRGARLYGQYCVPCHGPGGQGDGFNWRYLPKSPADHTDASRLSGRHDDDLLDIIDLGGPAGGLSNLMPPFGGILKEEEMRELIAHIRVLCRCQGE